MPYKNQNAVIYGEPIIEDGKPVMQDNGQPKQRSMRIGKLFTGDDGSQFMYINSLPAGKMAANWDGKVNFYESDSDTPNDKIPF